MFYIASDEEGKIWPAIQEVEVGHTFEIYCSSVIPSAWAHNKKTLIYNKRVVHLGDTIKFSSAKISDQGSYYCSGTKKNGTEFIATSILIVLSKFYIAKKYS